MNLNRRDAVARALDAIEMAEQACSAIEPLVRAERLAQAQIQLGWALRSAVAECQDSDRHSWAEIGDAVGLARETVYRQYQAEGPVVINRAAHGANSRNSTTPTTFAGEGIFAFQTEEGEWFGDRGRLAEGQYTDGWMEFAPADGRPGQMLRVRIGALPSDVSMHAALVQMRDGSRRRVRLSFPVLNLLFEDGQTPLRRALTAVVHVTLGNPNVSPQFAELVDAAARAQVMSTAHAGRTLGERLPAPAFLAAAQAIVDYAMDAPLDMYAEVAVRRLARVLREYHAVAPMRGDPAQS